MAQPTEADLRRFYERSPVGFYRSTLEGRFIYVNPAMVKLLGYTNEAELLALDLATDVYAVAGERDALVAQYQREGLVEGVRVRWRRADGRQLALRMFGYVVKSSHEVRFDTTVVDVTELEAAELALGEKARALEATAGSLRLVLNQMPALTWTVDTALRLTSTAGAVSKVLGMASGAQLGKPLDALFGDPQLSARLTDCHVLAMEGKSTSLEVDYQGHTYTISVAPQRANSGAIVGVIGAAVDVTQPRLLERRMVEAQRAESLGVLAGGLAHDFNNLLVAVLGNADLGLRELAPNSRAREAISNVRLAALRAADLTNELLAYAGRGPVTVSNVEVGGILSELTRIMRAAIPAHIRMEVDITALPLVRGDATQVRQVLMNLIANARDALSPRGGTIRLRTYVATTDGQPAADDVLPPQPGPHVVIEVSDDGPGLDDGTRRRIFDPFFTTKPTGHGLGLASVLGIVRTFHGGIRLQTSVGAGAAFQVWWPCEQGASQAAAVPCLAQAKVLVIDDDAMVRDVLVRMLEDLGYAATAADNGEAGVALVRRDRFSVAIVDLTMPGLAGAALIRNLIAAQTTLKIMVCSGFDRDAHGADLGHAFLAKPFRLDALQRQLAALLAD